MAELSDEQLDQVALLARLELSEEERAKMRTDLNAILQHFQRLQELDTEGVPPTSHVLSMENVLRDDVSRPSLPREAFMGEAPGATDEFFVVPRIVEG